MTYVTQHPARLDSRTQQDAARRTAKGAQPARGWKCIARTLRTLNNPARCAIVTQFLLASGVYMLEIHRTDGNTAVLAPCVYGSMNRPGHVGE